MTDDIPRTTAWRTSAITALILSAWAVLGLRLVHVQWYQAEELNRLALRQSEVEVTVPARPADITDRNGKLLASTIATPSLFIDPARLKATPEFITQIADAVHLNPGDLAQRLDQYREKRFMWVKRRLTTDEIDNVLKLKWPEATYGLRDEFLRQYPQDSLAAHVLGLRDIDGAGRGGVEQSLDHLIRGQPGRRRLEKDARGRILEVEFSAEDEPRQFQAVQLTIDLAIQMFAEKELDGIVKEWKPRAATAIVMDPQSGEVLAMASRPTYSPNDLRDVPEEAWKNQAINIIYEPGSTFKPVIVAWALQKDLVQRDEVFFCENGKFAMPGRTKLLTDVHPYGHLNVTDILVKSSNIGMAKIGLRMEALGLYEAAWRFGFGRPTGIELPGELRGIFHPLSSWTKASLGSIPMGAEISVTPLQLITAYAALANGGKLISPSILNGVQDDGSNRATTFAVSREEPQLAQPAKIVTKAVDEEIADWLVQEPMVQVVRRGTGIKARIPGYTVFGKTGTAKKWDPKIKAYSDTKNVASFIGGAPAHHPKVLVLVVVDEPKQARGFGGVIAAPPASRILQRTLTHLRIPPDQDAKTAQAIDEIEEAMILLE